MEDRGGLDYNIDVSGSFDTKLDAFISKVQKLDTAVTSLSKKSSAAASGAGGGGGRGSGSAASLEKRQRDLIKKTAQKEEQRETKRRKKLEADRLANIRRAANEARKANKEVSDAQAKHARQRNKELTQQGDLQRKNAAAALKAAIIQRDKVRSADAKKAAQGITAAETANRKKSLALLKEDIIARSKADEQRLATGARAITQAEAEEAAALRSGKAANEIAIKRAQIAQIVKQTGVSERRAAELVGVSSAQAKRLGLNMWDAQHAARQFLFTFRRLVGILAVFTAARKLAQAIAAAVREMADFNAELEIAQISVAAILASVGQIRNDNGDVVKGQEAFTIALKESANQVRQLKREAVGSIATFEALVQSYQVAIGPGLAAGLDPDQIRVLSKRLAEGAVSLGVPLNQLSEEIRSLLSGTATARNTRIAVLFGGAKEANEAVRIAKEQGNLYETLVEKLSGVAEGADVATTSLNVLKSDLQDAVQLLLAQGGLEYFDELKESFLAFREALVSPDADGDMIFSPAALGVVQEIGDTLASMIRSFREFTDTQQVFKTLESTLSIVGDALKLLAPLAAAIFQGIAIGVNAIVTPLKIMADLLGAVGKSLGGKVLLKTMAALLTMFVAARIAIGGWVALSGVASTLFAFLQKSSVGMLVNLEAAKVAIHGFNIGMVSANTLMASLGVFAKGVAGAVTAASGGLNLVLFAIIGIVLFLVSKFKLIDRLLGKFTGNIQDAQKEVDELTGLILGSAEATQEGVKTAKEWADALKEAKKQTAIEESIAGVSKEVKNLLKLLASETAEFDKQTGPIQDSVSLLQKRKKEIKSEMAALKTRNELIEKATSLEELFAEIPDLTAREVQQFTDRFKALSTNAPLTVPVHFDISGTTEDLVLLERSLLAVNAELENKEKVLVETREASLKILKEQVKQYELQNTLINEQQAVGLAKGQQEIAKAENARSNDALQRLATAEAEKNTLEAQIALERKRDALSLKALETEIDKLDGVAGREAELIALQNEYTRAVERSASARDVEDAKLAEIEQRLNRLRDLSSDDFLAGMRIGLEEFTEELEPLATQIAEIMSDAMSDLAGVVADVFKDAIDPRTDADIATAFGEFFLDLAGQFVEAVTSQIIAAGLTKLGIGAAKPAQEVATTNNTLALDRNTAALQASSTAAGTAGEGAASTVAVGIGSGESSGGAEAAAEGASKAGGLLGGAVAAAPWLLAILLPILIALITSAFKKGGKVVQGFASGGDVNKLPRPSHIPASDTVPAWLTPGEFVMRKEAVARYGAGLMEAINRGILNPSTFAVAGMALGGRVRGIQAFATGGGVGVPRAVMRQGNGQTVVLPVIPASEDNMDKLIAGGRGSFSANMNKTPFIGDPNRSGRW